MSALLFYHPIKKKKTTANGISGKYFNLTGIHREHMGKYVCAASNGIPPDDFKVFDVEVYCEFYSFSFTSQYTAPGIIRRRYRS
jgi:hypothetical protein